MKCKICGKRATRIFEANFLGKHRGFFDYCRTCGYLSVTNPYWLAEAYSDAISATDTGLVQRNFFVAQQLSVFIYFFLGMSEKDQFLDYAGGFGLLTRLMRDRGFNFYWQDPYCVNLVATGFGFDQTSPPFKAVTMFEALEHLDDPLASLENILKSAESNTLVFSTLLYGDHPPQPDKWWYYSLESGQHISFFSLKTLSTIGKQMGLNCYSTGSFHVLTNHVFNPIKFRLVCNPRFTKAMYPLIKTRFLPSLTWSDHLYLVKKV